jgi:hypothetical protein
MVIIVEGDIPSGTLKLWIDGTLVASETGVSFRPDWQTGVSRLFSDEGVYGDFAKVEIARGMEISRGLTASEFTDLLNWGQAGLEAFAPTITSAPQITGDPAPGSTVTIVEGIYSGSPAPTLTPTLTLDGVDVTANLSGLDYTIPEEASAGEVLEYSETASNGISPDAQDSVSVTVQDNVFTPASLFAGGQEGLLLEAFDIDTLFQVSDGTTPVTVATNPIGYFGDNSGNDNHATQATAARRLTYQTGPARATLDKVDDRLSVTVPTGGFTGTMVLATDQGTASYGVNIPAGAYDIGGRSGQYFPGNAIVGKLIRDGALSAGDAAATEAYFVANGATASYGAVTDFSSYWKGWREITSFPLIDTSSGTNFFAAWSFCTSLTSFPLIDTSLGTNFGQAWRNCTGLTSFPLIDTSSGTDFDLAWRDCSSLTSFPLIDTSSGTSFIQAWFGCTSLTSFPLIDTSSGTNFKYAWFDCTSLTSFPANAFDNIKGGNFANAFTDTALTQTSIDNILVSLVASGISAGVFDQSGGSAPSAGGEAAIDTLRSRGWTVTVTGGY